MLIIAVLLSLGTLFEVTDCFMLMKPPSDKSISDGSLIVDRQEMFDSLWAN